jgi:hypothetical protein
VNPRAVLGQIKGVVMFEKEAEEYIKKDGTETENMLNNITLSLTIRQAFVLKNAFKQTFKDGAEYGYNKANEWHYVKNELPPEDVPLLCVRDGKIYVAWYWDNIYHDSRCCQVKKPYAWKEIVLPEQEG